MVNRRFIRWYEGVPDQRHPITAPCRIVLRTLGYLSTRECLFMKACQPATSNGVAGLVRLSAMTVDSTILVSSTTGAAMARAVMFAGASLWKLEVE
jgi:hypothetical protein